jgi:hypothetical protein
VHFSQGVGLSGVLCRAKALSIDNEICLVYR